MLHAAVRSFARDVWFDQVMIASALGWKVSDLASPDVEGMANYLRVNRYAKLGDDTSADGLAANQFSGYLRAFAQLGLVLEGEQTDWEGKVGVNKLNTSWFYLHKSAASDQCGSRFYVHATMDQVPEVARRIKAWAGALPDGKVNAKFVGPKEAHRTDNVVVYVQDGVDASSLPGRLTGVLGETLPLTVELVPGISQGPGMEASWGDTCCRCISQSLAVEIWDRKWRIADGDDREAPVWKMIPKSQPRQDYDYFISKLAGWIKDNDVDPFTLRSTRLAPTTESSPQPEGKRITSPIHRMAQAQASATTPKGASRQPTINCTPKMQKMVTRRINLAECSEKDQQLTAFCTTYPEPAPAPKPAAIPTVKKPQPLQQQIPKIQPNPDPFLSALQQNALYKQKKGN
jgi:hypothetical protein